MTTSFKMWPQKGYFRQQLYQSLFTIPDFHDQHPFGIQEPGGLLEDFQGQVQAIIAGGFAWAMGNVKVNVRPNIDKVTPKASVLKY